MFLLYYYIFSLLKIEVIHTSISNYLLYLLYFKTSISLNIIHIEEHAVRATYKATDKFLIFCLDIKNFDVIHFFHMLLE